MSTVSTTRAAYQHHPNGLTMKRPTVATRTEQATLDEIVSCASNMKLSTTNAAYSLRLDTLRKLVRSLSIV